MLMLLQVRKRNGSEKALDVNRPVKKIMSPVEAYLDDRGARKVSTGLPVSKSCVLGLVRQQQVRLVCSVLHSLAFHSLVRPSVRSFACLFVHSFIQTYARQAQQAQLGTYWSNHSVSSPWLSQSTHNMHSYKLCGAKIGCPCI